MHVAVVSRLAQKARRLFSGSAREIWDLLKPKICALESLDCFEGLGMLHLLMPCSRVSECVHTSTDENANENDGNDWRGWFEEWVAMAGWMPTNRFWQAAWFAMFAQLAKHDSNVLVWDARQRAGKRTCGSWRSGGGRRRRVSVRKAHER